MKCANLSTTMRETIRVMRKHGNLVRYKGGFWSWENVDLKTRGENRFVPTWFCNVQTLRALDKRKLVLLDEDVGECKLISL